MELTVSNDTVVIQHYSIPTIPLVKSSMSRILVYRTNKEFDKCAELLRNILTVQESRDYSKSPAVRKANQKKQQQSSTNSRTKKQNSKQTVTKSSFVKTNINSGTETGERRSSYSPNKTSHATVEESSLSKNRLSPNKSRKHVARSPSPPQTAHQRFKSPLINNNSRQKSSPSSVRRHNQTDEELVRSSSCGDLPYSKSNFMHKEQTRFILDQLITHLTSIRTISKQIRTRNSHSINDPLWNELEKSLSSALSYANHDIQLQLSLTPLRTEIIELRKQLQTTNVHLHEYDLSRRNNDQYVNLQKKFDRNQIQCTQLLLHNEQLKTKCYLLQDKLDDLERNNIRLIQRLTQQDLRSIPKRTEWISTDNRFLLREEIGFLKEKLCHVYDDLSTLFNRNQTLQSFIRDQKQQLILYKQQFNDLRQSAQHLLRDLDNRLIEEKIKRFLNTIIIDQHQNGISKSSVYQTPTAVSSSSFLFETSHKQETAISVQPVITRLRATPNSLTNKLRPKSLFVTPNVLNDSEALSKFQHHRSPILDVTHCSSSTIDDADSTLTSSSSTLLYYQQRKRPTLYNSLPSLTVPTTIDITKPIPRGNQHIYNNESSRELDQISDLTSKIFSSGDEEDLPNHDINTSTSSSSSSTIPSDAEKLMHM